MASKTKDAIVMVVMISLGAIVSGDPNPASLPWAMNYSRGVSVGPDGPWNYINQNIDFPDQLLAFHPSYTDSILIISASACNNDGGNCPVPLPDPLYTASGAQGIFAFENSDMFPASQYDGMAAPLNLSGSGFHMVNRVGLSEAYRNIQLDGLAFVEGIDYSPNYPQTGYRMTTGLLSLLSKEDNVVEWQGQNQTTQAGRMVPDACGLGAIPSNSYGLHIGSVEPNISGVLHLGGYDSSRVLEPVITTNGTPRLLEISLDLYEGFSAYEGVNLTSIPVSQLMKGTSNESTQLSAMPNPGVPYMYLPRETCDAIAKFLPVSYDEKLNLYLWDTSRPSYKQIVSSPHYINFTFAADPAPKSISVPFNLLNLTLEAPLVKKPTQYFPCSPYDPTGPSPLALDKSEKTYHLGRAFLQAAFVGHNWHTGTMWLAQAPGPDVPFGNVTRLSNSTTTLSPLRSPSWVDTWRSTLKPIRSEWGNGISGSPDKSTGISSAAAAGIGVACVAILGMLGYFAWWKTRRIERLNSTNKPRQELHSESSENVVFRKELSNSSDALGEDGMGTPTEAEGSPVGGELASDVRFEMDGGIPEMDGKVPTKRGPILLP